MIEAALAVLVGSIGTERETLVLCKFKVEMDGKDPYFRGLNILG